MGHPPAVLDKARRMERLLLRVEAGESLSQVCADLDLKVKAKDLPRLQAKYEKGGRTWEALIDGRYGHPQTAHSALREWMYERKREDETLTASQMAKRVEDQFGVKLDPGHINYLLRKVGLTRPPGRPPSQEKAKEKPESEQPDQSLDNAGVFFPGSGEARDGGHRGR
jgi:transposase